jgi:hypothetical protein
MVQKSLSIGFSVKSSHFSQMFKLLSTSFEAPIDQGSDNCLHPQGHEHIDFITLTPYLVLQILDIFWSVGVPNRLLVATRENV